jgi:hypothetical protein
MNEKEINEAFDREYKKHIKDIDENNFVKIKMPTYYIAKHSDEDLQAAVLAEREACAKLCDEEVYWDGDLATTCAAAIRGRTE